MASTPCIRVLVCPVCGEALHEVDRSLRCPRRHTFDRAREGYFHLLPAGHGRSRLEGDTREMVQARRRFLERGHYEPLSRAINACVLRHTAGLATTARGEGVPARITALEVGCGEGYYIGALARAVPSAPAGSAHCFLGLDISKEAVRLAARTHREVLFLINDVKHRICVADGAVDVLLDIFAPRGPAEFARVVRPGGLLIVAIPSDDHLRELRACLPMIGIEAGKRDRTVGQFEGAFQLVAEESVEYRTELVADAILDLLRMTPNYWHLDEATLADVAAWEPSSVTISVLLLAFRRRPVT